MWQNVVCVTEQENKMNQQQIEELLENEEMEVNESLYLKQLIEEDKESLLIEQIKEFREFLNHKYNKQ